MQTVPKTTPDINENNSEYINVISGCTFDEERALYNIKDTKVVNCVFAGDADGESVLKEGRHYLVDNCSFSLRYPMWHAHNFVLTESYMDEKTRAPLWYCVDGKIQNCNIDGIKCLRECRNVKIKDCVINSPEFGWKCDSIIISDSKINAPYFLFETNNVDITNLDMTGKYSFQYMENLHIKDSRLDTKDAFWHSKNVLVENSLLKGEYLGWFSENLTLVNCKITGTQPLCYCKNLKLINCTMENTDLAFEYSEVEADIKGHIDSVKNPKSGTIKADSVGEIIEEEAIMPCCGQVITRIQSIRRNR